MILMCFVVVRWYLEAIERSSRVFLQTSGMFVGRPLGIVGGTFGGSLGRLGGIFGALPLKKPKNSQRRSQEFFKMAP